MKFILAFVLFFIFNLPAYANDVSGVLDQAQEYFDSEEYEAALNILLDKNLANDPQANYLVGEIYFLEENIKAVRYYIKAAKLGNTDAMNQLGSIYSYEWLNQQEDHEKARYWWEKAVENKNYEGAVDLSRFYYSDLEDYVRSLAFIKELKSKNIDDELLQRHIYFYLGQHYKYGKGVNQNISKAELNFKKAIVYGSENIYGKICEMHSNEKFNHLDIQRALACYRDFNNQSEYSNFDVEIAHLEKEIEYADVNNSFEIPTDDKLHNSLVGIWRLEMDHESFRTKKLLIFDINGRFSLHSDMISTYGRQTSHQQGAWFIKNKRILTKIEEPSIYKGREGVKRLIGGLTNSHLLINLLVERHVYERVTVLSEKEKELAMMLEPINDMEISELIVGKWSGKLEVGFSEIDTVTEYRKDGSFQATGSYSDLSEGLSFEVSGTWVAEEGFIVQQLLKAKPEEMLEDGNEVRIKVINIGSDHFKYYDVDSGLTVLDNRLKSRRVESR
ncbi:MAG: tetratricopeptide repeat protein [Gammaproteobacteria bacterium]